MNKMNYSKIGLVLCSALLGFTTYGQPSVSVGVSVPLPSVEIRVESDFYEPLTPHGEWVVVGSYGRCWRPARIVAGWRPYCNGNWQRTDAGWYWVSDEPWAWATYHYGRWDFTDRYGWYWVPQTQWAPAWVSWHSGGGYVGWAPLYPSGVVVISPRAYVFVEQRRFLDPISPTIVVANNTPIINQTVIHEAPTTTVIEKASGRKVQAVPVQELRHKTEATVVAQQRKSTTTSNKKVQPTVASEGEPRGAKAVAAPPSPQVQAPAAATRKSAAPAPKKNQKNKAQSENPKSAPAASEFKPEARPEGNQPAVNEQPTGAKADKKVEKQEKPAASEKNGANPTDKDHEKKPKD